MSAFVLSAMVFLGDVLRVGSNRILAEGPAVKAVAFLPAGSEVRAEIWPMRKLNLRYSTDVLVLWASVDLVR